MQNVFEQQPADVQDFLLTTSILDRLSGSLCDAVAERTASHKLLEALEHANLFIIPLDQSRTWYQYHRLFSELLRHRLRALGDFSETLLHQRASQWYQTEGYILDAIPHALAGSDWERATELILNAGDDMLKRGEIVTVLGWYSRIPKDVLLAHPRLCMEYSWPLMLAGQFETAASYLSHTEQSIMDDPTFLGETAAAQAYLARPQGDHPRMVELSQRALSLLPKSDVSTRSIIAINLGIAYWHSGQMGAAEQALAEALETAQRTENQHAALTALIFQGRVMAVRGRLRQAAEVF